MVVKINPVKWNGSVPPELSVIKKQKSWELMMLVNGSPNSKTHYINEEGKLDTKPFSQKSKYYFGVPLKGKGFTDLYNNLHGIAQDNHWCIIQAELIPDLPPNTKVYKEIVENDDPYKWVQATSKNTDFYRAYFRERSKGLNVFCIDSDKITLPDHLSVTKNPVESVAHVVSLLPDYFKGVSYVYQLSSSAGIYDDNTVKVHLWFLLQEPKTNPKLKDWAIDANDALMSEKGISVIDISIYHTVHLHYTSAPLFEDGIQDPFPHNRMGMVTGVKDTVLLPDVLPKPKEYVYQAYDSSNNGLSSTEKFEAFLALIGDHEGGLGFYKPVWLAIGSYVWSNYTQGVDKKALIDIIQETTQKANHNKHHKNYAAAKFTDFYLNQLIDLSISGKQKELGIKKQEDLAMMDKLDAKAKAQVEKLAANAAEKKTTNVIDLVTKQEIVEEDTWLNIMKGSDFVKKPLSKMIMEDIYQVGTVNCIYGNWSSGKTFFLIDQVGCITRGVDWRDRYTEQGKWLFIVAEGSGGFRGRLIAYQLKHPDFDLDDVYVIGDCPDFTQDKDLKIIQAKIKALEEQGITFIGISVDTLVQVSAGIDQNSTVVQGAIKNIKKLSTPENILILVDHTGKELDKGISGSNSKPAGYDTVICIEREGESRTAMIKKSKDGSDDEETGSFPFQLEEILIYKAVDPNNYKDKDRYSCVVEHTMKKETEYFSDSTDKILYQLTLTDSKTQKELIDILAKKVSGKWIKTKLPELEALKYITVKGNHKGAIYSTTNTGKKYIQSKIEKYKKEHGMVTDAEMKELNAELGFVKTESELPKKEAIAPDSPNKSLH